jgi:DNA-binding MarR family transcriptional regulator
MLTPLEQLGLSIKLLQDRHQRVLDARLAAVGLTLVQWHALREIDRHPGNSQIRLAELTFNSPQAFGALVGRMEAAGLVARDSGLGRAFAIHLTARGKQLLKEGRRPVSAALSESFKNLNGSERVALQRLLDKALGGPLRDVRPDAP